MPCSSAPPPHAAATAAAAGQAASAAAAAAATAAAMVAAAAAAAAGAAGDSWRQRPPRWGACRERGGWRRRGGSRAPTLPPMAATTAAVGGRARGSRGGAHSRGSPWPSGMARPSRQPLPLNRRPRRLPRLVAVSSPVERPPVGLAPATLPPSHPPLPRMCQLRFPLASPPPHPLPLSLVLAPPLPPLPSCDPSTSTSGWPSLGCPFPPAVAGPPPHRPLTRCCWRPRRTRRRLRRRPFRYRTCHRRGWGAAAASAASPGRPHRARLSPPVLHGPPLGRPPRRPPPGPRRRRRHRCGRGGLPARRRRPCRSRPGRGTRRGGRHRRTCTAPPAGRVGGPARWGAG